MQNRPSSFAPRRMTRQQYEAQRRQNRIALAVIAGIAVLLIVAVVLSLRPRTPDAVATAADAGPVDSGVQSEAPAFL